MIRRLALTVAAGVLACAPAWAQDSRLEISGNAGWTLSDGVSGQAIVAPDGNAYNRIDPKDSFSFSFTLGYYFTENFELEALYDRQQSTLEAGGTTTKEVGSMGIDNYHGLFVYNFFDSDASVRPYVFGGAGATHYAGISYTGVGGGAMQTSGETKFSTTWGAGVKIYPGRSVGLRLGVRWTPTYIKSDFGGIWCDPYWGWCYAVGDPQYSNQFEASGGLTLRF